MPLMWNAINDDLLHVDHSTLSPRLANSYAQVLRYYGRALGTTYDNDAKVWTIGVIDPQSSSHSWHGKLRFARLKSDNIDNINIAPTSTTVGNQVNKIAENLVQLDINYQLPLFNDLLALNADLSHSTFIERDSRNDINLKIGIN